jgi:crotonobetaine/carnitine-CoA ligase
MQHPEWRLLADELASAAHQHPDRPFLTLGGATYTYAEAWAQATAAARALLRAGAEPGDRVAILSGNRIEVVWTWFGARLAGCVDVPLNAESRGAQLAYFVEDCSPAVLVATHDLAERLQSVLAAPPAVVVVVDREEPEEVLGSGPRYLSWSQFMDLSGEPSSLESPGTGPRRCDALASIVYTSGTTGASKGVMWPEGCYPAIAHQFLEWGGLGEEIAIYCVQPLYHLDGRSSLLMALYARGRATLGERFSASRFWAEMDAAGCNSFIFIGTMLHLLAKQRGNDRAPDAPVATGIGSATPATLQNALESRFRVRLLEGYGMTEVPLITAVRRDSTVTGTVGTVADLVELELVDDLGGPVEAGMPGLLRVRPRVPCAMSMGYWNKPESTEAAFADGWFHTGDLLRALSHGGYEYIGRQKDSIRRRGENVSAWEVEQTALLDDGILECAAFGVPSDVGDEDVALLVVVRDPSTFSAEATREAMSHNLAGFALPRYIEVVDSLPKTPSERVNKAEVRARGLTEAAVDLQPAR